MVASIASPIGTRTLTAVDPRTAIRGHARQLHILYVILIPMMLFRREAAEKKRMALPVKVGDKPLERLNSWKEVRFGFRSAGFGFRSRWTLILFRLVLILFRRVLNSFHASWRLERGAAWTRFGLRRCKMGKWASEPAQPFERAQFVEGKSLDFPSLAWIYLPRFAQKKKLSGPPELDEQ